METVFTQNESSERYQLALEAAGIGIYDVDLVKDTANLSGYGAELFGVKKGVQLSMADLMQKIHTADRERTLYKVNQSIDPAIRAPYDNEYRIVDLNASQSVRWIRAKGKAYFTEEGIPYRFTGTVQDITDEVATRETQQKLLALVDNSIELMSILENNQRNSYINKAGMEMLGFDTLQQVYETPISDLHTPEDIAFVQANVIPAVMGEGKWSGMMNVKHLKTGEIFPVYNNTIRINDPVTGEPLAIGAVMRDMRPEMAAKSALEESERNFRLLVMQAPVGICILKGEEFLVEIANDTFLEVAWEERDKIIGKRVVDCFPEAARHGFDALLKQVYTSGQPYYGKEVEVLQERNGENKTIYVDFTFQPMLEPGGTVGRIINLSIDVTDKVQARKRLQESEEQLQQRVAERTAELEKKNKELEEFTYVSSHDLQEPLRKIKMFREMIRDRDYDKLSDFSKVRFDKVGESVERMSKSLVDLLNYASLDKQEQHKLLDLNDVIYNVEQDLELLIEQKHAIIEKDQLPTIMGIPQQMHRLFYNLLSNALKFSKQEMEPRIKIQCTEPGSDILMRLEHKDARINYTHIMVSDNGIGFQQDKAEKIFGVFQRLHTRNEYSGTGIGLALCRKVVNNHRGLIYAEGETNGGATFHIILPVHSNELAKHQFQAD